MILSEEQLKEIILTNPNGKILSAARKSSDLYVKYITGDGLKDSIDKLPYFEKDELTQIRKKLTRSTRDLFDRLLQPIDKVWNAKGGVVNYNLSNTEESKFSAKLNNVSNGMSFDEWMQTIAIKAYLLDPMSLLYTDIDSEGNVMPCYKCTTEIYDYQLTGRKPEYVVFILDDDEIAGFVKSGKIPPPGKSDKLFRVVDDASDMIVIQKGRQINIAYSLPNFFKYVPGIIASDIPCFNSTQYESPLAPIMELAADFFNDNSSKSLFKKYQMHLKEWGIMIDCKKCEGTKVHNGKECDRCDGSGIEPGIKVSERLAVGVNEDGTAKIPTPPGGYIAPPVESWDMMNLELDSLKQDMNDTFWGNSKMIKTTGVNPNINQPNTATGEIYNERSKEPKLKKFSKWAQGVHKNIVDNIKKVVYRSPFINESTIIYGDRYLLESPDELLSKYNDLKKADNSYPVLNEALMEALEAIYAGNPAELRRHEILMKIEPYVHHTLNEVISMQLVPDDLKAKKVFFPQWLNDTDPMFIYTSNEQVIRNNFEEYVKSRSLAPVVIPQQTKLA